MAVMIDLENNSLLRSAPRLIQILRMLTRHKFIIALRGKKHRPPPKEVREIFEELELTFLKFAQVLAMRRDLLPDAYINNLELLHDKLPALVNLNLSCLSGIGIDAVRAAVELKLGAQLTELFSSFSESPPKLFGKNRQTLEAGLREPSLY